MSLQSSGQDGGSAGWGSRKADTVVPRSRLMEASQTRPLLRASTSRPQLGTLKGWRCRAVFSLPGFEPSANSSPVSLPLSMAKQPGPLMRDLQWLCTT